MLIVGSDRLCLSGVVSAPEGTRHAVDVEGRVLCRTSRARFTWPHLAWDAVSADEGACRLCAQVRTAQEALAQGSFTGSFTQESFDQQSFDQFDPYPSESASEQPAFAPWHPAPGLFVPNGQ
jgi:hypothetical protein